MHQLCPESCTVKPWPGTPHLRVEAGDSNTWRAFTVVSRVPPLTQGSPGLDRALLVTPTDCAQELMVDEQDGGAWAAAPFCSAETGAQYEVHRESKGLAVTPSIFSCEKAATCPLTHSKTTKPRKMEQNRHAASRYRQRQRAQREALEAELRRQLHRNAELQGREASLRRQTDCLQELLTKIHCSATTSAWKVQHQT